MEERKVAAIIPAYNEENTISAVISTLVASGRFEEIVVISDGSTDDTAKVARIAGATLVHELPWKHGKGAAMGHGVAHTDSPILCFFDADLKGLTVSHIHSILDPVVNGEMYMHIGLREHSAFWTILAKYLPMIGGERAMRREIFEAIPNSFLAGFKVESSLNYFCRVNSLSYGVVVLPGLSIVRKMEKVGVIRGLIEYIKMWYQIFSVMIQVRVARRRFKERGTHMSHKHH